MFPRVSSEALTTSQAGGFSHSVKRFELSVKGIDAAEPGRGGVCPKAAVDNRGPDREVNSPKMANPKSYKSWLLSPLHKAHRQVSLYMESQMKDLDLSMTEGHLLSYVARYGPCTVGELLRVLGLPKSTLTSMLDRLEQRELVTRELNPADRRSFLVATTHAGAERVTESGRFLQEFEAAVKGRVTPEAIEGMHAVLEAISGVSQVDVRSETTKQTSDPRRREQ